MIEYNYKYFLDKQFKNWNTNKFEWNVVSSMNLLIHCSKYMYIWWDPDKYSWQGEPKFLNKYCKKYKSIWQMDYIIWKLH